MPVLLEGCYNEAVRTKMCIRDRKKLKFSYNEQREFETIDAVLAELEEKLAACRRAQEACGSDYVRLQELTDEQERLSAELDEKTERWVYLNDLKEKIDAQNSQG